jgi:hypothetical protein
VKFRHFFRPDSAPPVERLLLVESGSRHLLERLIPYLRTAYGENVIIDLCTCFPGAPTALGNGGKIYRTRDFTTPESRQTLFRELRANGYATVGIICSAEPIMTKWKWTLLYQVNAHSFLINENADFVWFDYKHWKVLAVYARTRLGFEDAGAVRTLARIVLLPFGLLYLTLYALKVHALRAWRQRES